MMNRDTQIIEELGGTCKVASMCQVTYQAVTQWKRKGIPPARRMYLELLHPEAFKVKRRRQAG